MADTSYLTEYAALARHRAEMQTATRRRRIRVALTAAGVLVVAGAGYWLSPPLGLMLAGVGAMVLFFAAMTGGSSVPADQMTGVEGEVRALEVLKQLSDDHAVFNQVSIPDAWLPNGRRELDFVVVTPAAVAIVEVKNTPGLIYIAPDKRHWQVVRRAGCGSRPGWNAIDNPLRQVRAQADALRRSLLEHGLSADVHPVVCFARPEVTLHDTQLSDIPVVSSQRLNQAITNLPETPRLAQSTRAKLIRLLAEGRERQPVLAA